MTWTVDKGIQCQNLVAQIETRLTGSGWTEIDSTNKVFRTTTNQGATAILQVGQAGTYQYIYLQGWYSWLAGSGLNGSPGQYCQIYFASAAQAGTVTVDLYMSVTANRVIIFIDGVGLYANWGYFGGLDSLAASNDHGAVVITAAAMPGYSATSAYILLGTVSGWWGNANLCTVAVIGNSMGGGVLGQNGPTSFSALANALMSSDGGKALGFPVLVVDSGGPRGNLDGLLYCPLGTVYDRQTFVVAGVTYLMVVPRGEPANLGHPLTGNFYQALLIPQV